MKILEEQDILENGIRILENMLVEILKDWHLTSPQQLRWLQQLQSQSPLCADGVPVWANNLYVRSTFCFKANLKITFCNWMQHKFNPT